MAVSLVQGYLPRLRGPGAPAPRWPARSPPDLTSSFLTPTCCSPLAACCNHLPPVIHSTPSPHLLSLFPAPSPYQFYISDYSPQLELLAFFCIESHFVISCPIFSKLPRSLLIYFPILCGAVRSTAQFVIICRFN